MRSTDNLAAYRLIRNLVRIRLLYRLGRWFLDRFISDEKYLALMYRIKIGKRLNLQKPQAFTEKIQWLKLNWRCDILTQCQDKYEVRKFVEKRIGADSLKYLYGVYDKTEDIDINQLPDAFVLKVNHGCKQNIFCKKKSELDWNHTVSLLKEYLKNNLYYPHREWAYKNIVPRIICEEHLTKDGETLYDYSFYCYNAVPRLVEIQEDKAGCKRINMFDINLNLLENKYKDPPLLESFVRPMLFEKMVEYAFKLSEGFQFVRVDLLYINNLIYFGEMTFYPLAGLAKISPESFDYFLGSFLQLPLSSHQ